MKWHCSNLKYSSLQNECIEQIANLCDRDLRKNVVKLKQHAFLHSSQELEEKIDTALVSLQ